MFASFLTLILSLAYALPQPTTKCDLTSMISAEQKQPGWYKTQEDLVPLRKSADFSGAILEDIPLTSNVFIGSCQRVQKTASTQGCWHPVHQIISNGESTVYKSNRNPKAPSAYIFSAALTSCFLLADLDQDNVQEQVILSYSPQSAYKIQVIDPNGASTITSYMEELTDTVPTYLSIIPAEQSGVPLLSLYTATESCGVTGFNYFYLYSNTPTQQLHKVISTSSFSDSPAHFYESIEWKANQTLVLRQDDPTTTSQQKYCLESFKYQPCGALKQNPKDKG